MRVLLCLMLMLIGHKAGNSEVRGSTVREIIDDQILRTIRPSYGQAAGECFTSEDFDHFIKSKTPERIVRLLQSNRQFLSAVEKVRAMPAAERKAYLEQCRLPLRKTWAQLGEVSPRGTTVAGQRAELALAGAIVALVVGQLLRDTHAAPAAAI